MFDEVVIVQGISKKYGPFEALHKINLEWAPGCITGILGPSGSGKTTLGEILAGIVGADEGRIFLGAEDVTDWKASRRRIPLMPQEWELFPHMTALENVGFGLWASGVDRATRGARARSLLEVVGLGGREHAFPRELSGGQQQRVALARALATPSAFVVLDEPFTSVDQDTRSGLRSILTEEAQRGRGILLITHDRTDALLLSHTIHCFMAGRLIMSGGPQEVYARPTSLQAALLTGEAFPIPLDGGRKGLQKIELESSESRRIPLPLADTPQGESSAPSVALARPEWLAVAHDGTFHLYGRVRSSRYLGSQFLVTVEDQAKSQYRLYSDVPLPEGAAVPLCIKQGVRLPVIPEN